MHRLMAGALTTVDFAMATTATLAIFLASNLTAVFSWLLTGGSVTAPLAMVVQGNPEGTAMAPGGMTDLSFVRWAIEQGGLVVAILVILYFYRRDFRTMENRQQEWNEQQAKTTAIVIELVKTTTTALHQLTEAVNDAQADRFPPRNHHR